MLSCKEVSNLVSQSQNRSLKMREQLAVKIHLLVCRMCRRYQRQISFLTEASRKLLQDPQKSELSLSENARTRIEQSLKQATDQPSKKDND